jgi:glycosyltransferase involved in cell wall biosynthesis
MPNLSIVIPCYNESKSLPKLLTICSQSIGERKNIEFVFVNNGSTDNSQQVFDQLFENPEFWFASLVEVPVNKGYGHGIAQGLMHAQGEILAWTHADLQTDPLDVIKAFEEHYIAIANNEAIVKGKRIQRPFFDNLFTKGMASISSALLKTKLSDVNAQPKIFNKQFWLQLENKPMDFSLDMFLLYMAQKQGKKIIEYPVIFGNRQFGFAKGGGSFKGKLKLILRTLNYIFELRRRLKLAKP